MAIVKADGYGHGAVVTSKKLLEFGANSLGVATLEEAKELRSAGINSEIFTLGSLIPEQAPEIIKFKITPIIYNLLMAMALNKEAKNSGISIPVHIKVDTGMGRIGVRYDEILEFLKEIKKFSQLKIKGIMTTFATADDLANPFFDQQKTRFKEVVSLAKSFFPNIIAHCANSASLIRDKEVHYQMVRPGLMLYGVSPFHQTERIIDLKPVMTIKSKIIDLKWIKPGEGVSYSHTFKATKNTKIAVIPFGYHDGISRSISNHFKAIIKGKMVSQVGNICMDLMMFDLSDVPDVSLYDEMTLLGRDGNSAITASDIARMAKTIPYEVLCNIARRVPRIYFEKEKIVEVRGLVD